MFIVLLRGALLKIGILLVIAIVVAATALIAFFANFISSPAPIGAHYLTYYPSHLTYGGNETKVLLLDSNIRYGVYDHDFRLLLCDQEVKKGDPCVIVNVTIRNDYSEEWPSGYFISLTAYLYDNEGKTVGRVMTYGQLHSGMVEVNLKTGQTLTFDIYAYYDKQDVGRRELYVVNILDTPTP